MPLRTHEEHVKGQGQGIYLSTNEMTQHGTQLQGPVSVTREGKCLHGRSSKAMRTAMKGSCRNNSKNRCVPAADAGGVRQSAWPPPMPSGLPPGLTPAPLAGLQSPSSAHSRYLPALAELMLPCAMERSPVSFMHVSQ